MTAWNGLGADWIQKNKSCLGGKEELMLAGAVSRWWTWSTGKCAKENGKVHEGEKHREAVKGVEKRCGSSGVWDR